MLYVFCTYERAKSENTWSKKVVHISTVSPDSPEAMTTESIQINTHGEDVGLELFVANLLRSGGAQVTLG